MATLRQPLFILLCLLFVVHQLLQKGWHIALSWADNYLDPLLCMPILFTLLLAERRHCWGKGRHYCVTYKEIVLAVIALSIIFEVVFPHLNARFTADWADVVAYVAGAVLFAWQLNRPLPDKL